MAFITFIFFWKIFVLYTNSFARSFASSIQMMGSSLALSHNRAYIIVANETRSMLVAEGTRSTNRAGGEYWNFSFSRLSYYRYYPELRVSRKNRSALEDDYPEVRVSRKNRSALEDADDDDCADSGEFVD